MRNSELAMVDRHQLSISLHLAKWIGLGRPYVSESIVWYSPNEEGKPEVLPFAPFSATTQGRAAFAKVWLRTVIENVSPILPDPILDPPSEVTEQEIVNVCLKGYALATGYVLDGEK